MTKPILLGLVAEAGSGKSTAAMYLNREYEAHVEAFAKNLKWSLKGLLHMPEVFGSAEDKEKFLPRWGKSAREIMQLYGEKMCHLFGPDFWVELCFRDVEYYRSLNIKRRLFVIDDTRKVNEAKRIIAHPKFDGHLIRLNCEDRIPIKHSNHATETEMNQIPAEWFTAEITYRKEDGEEAFKEEIGRVVQKILDGELSRV